MHQEHPLKELVRLQKAGIPKGIYSACTANDYVIEACMERALSDNQYVLIEATANQVNQFGGYTGMKPVDFREFTHRIARKVGFPIEMLILGGDHLGPLTWKREDAASAMEKSVELIRQYVEAGFTKMHLDTSMHLADDDAEKKLETKVIAERGAVLCKAGEEAFDLLRKSNPDSLAPVYVVGSEVPIPGGSQEEEEGIQVTKVQDFEDTIQTFKEMFLSFGLKAAWENVIAVVVQPGVEFGDETIHEYNREAAKDLCVALKRYPNLILEGHSTDYQTAAALKQMVRDGIAILKVGPALTFALREALFALNHMENALLSHNTTIQISNFIETLDKAMVAYPENWKNHYHEDEARLSFSRKYSLSDRARYYLPMPEVRAAMEQMIRNLKSVKIPLTIIDQYMPVQYTKIRNGQLNNDPEALLKDRVVNYIDDYMAAVIP